MPLSTVGRYSNRWPYMTRPVMFGDKQRGTPENGGRTSYRKLDLLGSY